MQTRIHPALAQRKDVIEADRILRSCVHCGFCTSACPTYRLEGDELDSPRGRIYLIKSLLEDNELPAEAATHLDRCLTCRACETSCPSGVEYARLLDIGKSLVSEQTLRPDPWRRLLARVLRWIIPRPVVFGSLLKAGQWLRPVLPSMLRQRVPNTSPRLPLAVPDFALHDPALHDPAAQELKTAPVLVLQGCVQRAATPGVNEALAQLLACQGIAVEYLQEESCCGALDHHLGAHDVALQRIKRLVDQLWPRVESVAAIVSSASGCGVTLKDYPALLQDEPDYLLKAQRLCSMLKDVSELLTDMPIHCEPATVAFQSPCTLQHGQKITGRVESILTRAGFTLVAVQDSQLCCGSAGTYSLLQPAIANQLRTNKLASLQAQAPDYIVTANVGCQLHLQSAADTPVMHWVELLAQRRVNSGGNSP